MGVKGHVAGSNFILQRPDGGNRLVALRLLWYFGNHVDPIVSAIIISSLRYLVEQSYTLDFF
jgi:hypothetical protein